MNRIILIGNGFDLSHGMKTSYKDFINNYWDKKLQTFQFVVKGLAIGKFLSGYLSRIDNGYRFSDDDINIDISADSYISSVIPIKHDGSGYQYFKSFISNFSEYKGINPLSYKNRFLGIISEKQQLKNWVDIEIEYFSELCNNYNNSDKIKTLNEEFQVIQKALEIYLDEQSKNSIPVIPEIKEHIYSDILFNDFIKKPDSKVWRSILFLVFNYTPTVKQYIDDLVLCKVINIHGEINNADNPIIFGYGDEFDEKYQLIEKQNDKECLKYIKSFKYSQTNNYRNLLTFLNSDDYQVFIMGHSCGISDRTLLNTLFEHENCKSIKIFYHIFDNGTDNYMDTAMNISRHFSKKDKMREILVSKESSFPLIKNK